MYLSFKHIEHIANEVLVQDGITSPKIMADKIAEFTYGLDIEWRNLEEYTIDGKILAAISFYNKKIYLNESFATELQSCPGRMNFTIAHELGHWVLHRELVQGDVLLCRGVDKMTDNLERQANLFATFLLMPEKFVTKYLRELPSLINERDFWILSKKFCVSKQAMKIRLVDELKLLYYANGRYYKNNNKA